MPIIIGYMKREWLAGTVGRQGLDSCNTFRCSNMSSSMGLKSFCPWCFKFGGNPEMIATHLREVHYRLAITCDLCKSFASMSTQSVLDHQLRVQGPSVLKNAQNKKDKRRQQSHIRRIPRHKNRKKHPKARLGSTKESWGVKRHPTPSVQFCWWMWVDSLPRSCSDPLFQVSFH